MKKIAIAFLLVVVFAAPTIACPLPTDVKIQKIVTDNERIKPRLNEGLESRLRSQLREAFSCRDKQPVSKTTGKEVVNVEVVEIIHEGTFSTRVNISTDHGFFSAVRSTSVYSSLTSQEQFEAVMERIAKDISKATCK